jgi:hypothetical protein
LLPCYLLSSYLQQLWRLQFPFGLFWMYTLYWWKNVF